MNRCASKAGLLAVMAALASSAAARADEPKPAAPAAAPAAPAAAPAAPAAAAAPAAPAEPAKPAPKWYDELQFNAFLSAGFNQNLSGSRTNGLRVFDGDANTFSIGVAELVLQKPLANPGDVGFRFDMDFGGALPGLSVYQGVDGKTRDPIGLRQAFASYIAPVGSGLRIDVGKFVTLAGFEYIETFDNPNDNYSRSLLFGYAIPFTHTGVQLSYAFSPMLKAVVQVVNGWDAETAQQNGKTGCAQLNFIPTDTINFYLNYCGGIETYADKSHVTRHLVDLNGSVKLTPWLTLGVNGDYGADVPTTGASAGWYGAALYVKAESESGLGLALRGEYFKDDKGARTGNAGAVSEVTVTPYVKINTRLIVRLEGRVDMADSEIFADGQSGKLSKTQATIALNTAFTY